ncbi:MAG: hypothetical protein HRT95_04665 [Moritella sp.]|uniref:hypothetical protein n=1 Tax=Moritella sp. TaxID=78556 RepID=UPI001D2B10FF|nr:hypothetical protein [Moritella sp.]NQZ49489.1 hypothetical protein [Moritella sp.]
MNYKYSTLALAVVALLTGCGAEDNKSIGDDNNIYPPIVKGDVTIPALHVGLTAQGAYQYFDPNPAARPEGNSKYSWRDANDTDVEFSTEKTLDLIYELLGESVEFCVTPVAQGTNSSVGDEVCSDSRTVLEPLGEKPVADPVELDNTTPQVGETLKGSYGYNHPDDIEGETSFTWYADETQIAGADAAILKLLASETEGKAVKFCVTPETKAVPPVRGVETCSVATALVSPVDGTAPIVEDTAIVGEGFVGALLTGDYTFVDAEGDLEGVSQHVWQRDDVVIDGATNKEYIAVDADENTNLKYCVTPKSATGGLTDGTQDCSLSLLIIKKVEAAPIAVDVKANVELGGIAEAGKVLVSNYTFQHDFAPEGDSVGNWVVDGQDVALPSCTVAQGCEYPLTQVDVGKLISFCVIPKTQLGTPGVKECSADVIPAGIQLSGVLEYDGQLTAVVYGYDGDVTTAGNWLVDASNQMGPMGDLDPTSQATGTTYTIGNRSAVTTDTNGNGVIDDYDWFAAPVSVDARNFIGKSVQFCLETVTMGTKCALAADFSDVTGGMHITHEKTVKRVIEPIRIVKVDVNSTATARNYHRPLTATEAQLKEKAGFGANIPTNSDVYLANGINWALFKSKESDLVPGDLHNNANADISVYACRNLYGDNGDWYLPITYKSNSSYEGNYFAYPDGNKLNLDAPTDGYNVIKLLVANYISGMDAKTSPEMSLVYGWPLGENTIAYHGASVHIAKGRFHTYRFNGGNTNTFEASRAQFVTCVQDVK